MRRVLLGLGILTQTIFAQTSNKGKIFAYWGWNRAQYSDSDITFKGTDYNFTLNDVVAKDHQTPFSFNKYLNPANMTIPQTNYGLGYFINDHYNIILAVDHMKYVMEQNQEVTINGVIGNSNSPFNGVYNDDKRVLTTDFLTFEHTDGLNYVHVAVNRFDDVSNKFNIHSKNFKINLTEGVGVGILYPKTNTKLMGNPRYDEFHVSGVGVSLQGALDFEIFKYFYIQTGVRTGFITMPDIRTTQNVVDSASQHFTYLQGNILIGGRFHL